MQIKRGRTRCASQHKKVVHRPPVTTLYKVYAPGRKNEEGLLQVDAKSSTAIESDGLLDEGMADGFEIKYIIFCAGEVFAP